jgi:hypothetical protein
MYKLRIETKQSHIIRTGRLYASSLNSGEAKESQTFNVTQWYMNYEERQQQRGNLERHENGLDMQTGWVHSHCFAKLNN